MALPFRMIEKKPQSHARLLVHGTLLGSAVEMEIEVTITEGKDGGRL